MSKIKKAADLYISHLEDDWPTLSITLVSYRLGVSCDAVQKELKTRPEYQRLLKLGIVGQGVGTHIGNLVKWQKSKGYNKSGKGYNGINGVRADRRMRF